MAQLERFSIDIATDVLRDLDDRLRKTRFSSDLDNADWRYGTNGAYLREVVDYWINRYDWRAAERHINRFAHYKVELDGTPIHFIRQPGQGPKPLPIILSHGWPWTFHDLDKVIEPLADPAAFGGDPRDAFEVIVPSLPGFGFSTPLAKSGMNFWKTADLWHRLMTEVLGFPKFAAQGGDWGALVTIQLAHKYRESLVGVHLTTIGSPDLFGGERPWDITGGMLAPPGLSAEEREEFLAWQKRLVSHVCVHMLDPQTLADAVNDSPAGLLSWLIRRRRAWGYCQGDIESRFEKDFLITTAMIYWVTQSFVTSARYYADAARYPWTASNNEDKVVRVPAGLSHMLGDGTLFPSGTDESMFEEVVLSRRHADGGHFAPWEIPEKIVEDIRATFRPLRDR